MIVEAIRHIHPDWEPPVDNGRTWVKALCPFHVESRPSAAVSFEHDAFKCLACGVGGNARGILRKESGLSSAEIDRFTEAMAPGSNLALPGKPARKPRREFLGDEGAGGQEDPRVVPSRVRERRAPWSRDV